MALVKVGIVGSRKEYWEKAGKIKDGRRKVNEYIWERRHFCSFISGDSPKGGIDQWCRAFCEARSIPFQAFTPKGFGARFLLERNTEIAENCHVLVAFCVNELTKGTADTVTKAIRMNKYVVVYTLINSEWKSTEYNKPEDIKEYLKQYV